MNVGEIFEDAVINFIIFIQTTHHEWCLQTPKAMWSIVVKTVVHNSE